MIVKLDRVVNFKVTCNVVTMELTTQSNCTQLPFQE